MNSTTNIPELAPILNGKWDAAMLWTEKDDIGFDLEGSPLGEEVFENMALENPGLKNKEVYTGYVYYKHYPAFVEVNGVPRIMDEQFLEELYRRNTIFYGPSTTPKDKVFANYKRYSGQKRSTPPENLISYWQKVRQWDPPKATAPRVAPFNFVEDKNIEALLLTLNRITPAIVMQVQQAIDKHKLDVKLSPAPKVVNQLTHGIVSFDSPSNEIQITGWDELPLPQKEYLKNFAGGEAQAKELFGLTAYGYNIFHAMGLWLLSQKGIISNTYESEYFANQFAVAFLKNIGQQENLKKLYDYMKAGLENHSLNIPAGTDLKEYLTKNYLEIIKKNPADHYTIQGMQFIEIMDDKNLPNFEELVRRELTK